MPLAIYVDESGVHDGADFIAMGGYVSWKDKWERFCGEWERVLCRYGVRDFHAVEFMRKPEIQEADKDSPYRGWDVDKREQFILDLASVARAHVVGGVVALVKLDDYNRILPKWLRNHVEYPYCFCFQSLLEIILEDWDKIFPGFHPIYSAGAQLAFVLDRNKQFSALATEVHETMANDRDPKHRIGSITFASRHSAIPIQASDLLIYRMVKRIRAIERTGTFPEVKSWDKALGADDILRVRYHSPESLQTIADNAERDKAKYQRIPPTS